jgi:DNA recombination protein RmuC
LKPLVLQPQFLALGALGIALLGLLFGAVLCYLWMRQAVALARLQGSREAHEAREGEVRELAGQLAAERARLEAAEVAQSGLREEREAAFENVGQRMENTFRALSEQALRSNAGTFLEIAREKLALAQAGSQADLELRQQGIEAIVNPLKASLAAVDAKIGDLEQKRTGAYEHLRTLVTSLDDTQRALRTETGNLVRALHSPVVRGRWGEVQLRRVVELAGMVERCDFVVQDTVEVEGGVRRPDMRVLLPGGNSVVVDSKVPLLAYLEALEAADEAVKRGHLQRHAAQVKTHIDQLSKKAYWEQFEAVPEFVVLFLPGEVFFSAALEQDMELIAYGAERRVILASPTTLIALLRTVHHGWRQEALAQNAAEISALGKELHKRLGDFTAHLAKVGSSLGNAVESFNRATGTLESRVLVSARRFEELQAARPDNPLPVLSPVERLPTLVERTE